MKCKLIVEYVVGFSNTHMVHMKIIYKEFIVVKRISRNISYEPYSYCNIVWQIEKKVV